MSMKLFAQIRKVDEEKRLVFGRAAEEVVDKADEIMDYASSKPHFVKWSEDIAKNTAGKSLGNVRAMHGKVAAGKLTGIDFNDTEKAIDICAKVVDDAEWKKVLEGVYTGFSMGGRYVGEMTAEKADDGRDVRRYTAAPNEISLVDRPCIPTAKFFDVQKADGTLRKVAFAAEAAAVETPDPDDVTVNGTAEEVAALGKLMNENGLTLSDLLAKAIPDFVAAKAKPAEAPAAAAAPAAPEKAATPEELKKVATAALRKGMYACESFAQIVSSLQSLQSSAAYEAYCKGDTSGIAAKIGACVSMCGSVLKEMLDEELAEIAARTDTPDPIVLEMAEKAGALAKFEGDPILELLKVGARNSAADKSRLAKIHEMTVELGHECAGAAAKLAKAEADTVLEKLVSTAVEPLQKLLDAQAAQIKKLESQPAPARVALRAVAKSADVIDDPAAPVAKTEPIVDDHGAAHEAASLIKSLHRSGGVPLTRGLSK